MNILKKSILLAGCMAALTLSGTTQLMAQGRPDPTQMRQDFLDNLRTKLDVKDDAEWSAIEPKVTKVMDAGRELMGSRMRGLMGFGGNRRRGGDNNNGGDSQRPRRGGFMGEPSPAVDALQKAIDAKAPKDEIKAKLAVVRAENKEKEAKLEQAEEDLRSVLNTRQEAVAVVSGLLR